MKLQVNGEEQSFPGTPTLAALIEQLGMRADRVAVELNREIVARDQWPATELREGDRLEIVQFVGGGSTPAGRGAMRWLLHLAAFGVFLPLLAQQPRQSSTTPAAETKTKSQQPCRSDRPVDEYIAELKKSKKQRNKNPLPTGVCLGNWCKGGVEMPTPEKFPPPSPRQPEPNPDTAATGESSSHGGKEATAQDEGPASDPMAAAQGVEVGDYYFGEKNYRAALSRYQEALAAKPNDEAIYLRLGRTFEKLGEPTHAFEDYDASLVADPAGPTAEEARKGAERLRPEVEKRGDDPGAISERNRAHIVPRCPKPAPASPNPSR